MKPPHPYNKLSFLEEDSVGGLNSFQLHGYDPVIGRWLSTDPYRQYASPYVGMGNDPVNGVDPDGGFKTKTGAWLYKVTHGGGEVYKIDDNAHGNHAGEWAVAGKSTGSVDNGTVIITEKQHYNWSDSPYEVTGTVDYEFNVGLQFDLHYKNLGGLQLNAGSVSIWKASFDYSLSFKNDRLIRVNNHKLKPNTFNTMIGYDYGVGFVGVGAGYGSESPLSNSNATNYSLEVHGGTPAGGAEYKMEGPNREVNFGGGAGAAFGVGAKINWSYK